jgi:hypothetical protein
MRSQPTWIRVKAAALVLCGIAAIAVAVAVSVPAVATGPARLASRTAARLSVPVVITCALQPQVRPSRYILACGDAGALVIRLSWASWGSSAAFAAGTYALNSCTPKCRAQHFVRFPMLAALWRAVPWPGHPGKRYFSRLTIIFTGNRAYRSQGKPLHLPATLTFPLSASGGSAADRSPHLLAQSRRAR